MLLDLFWMSFGVMTVYLCVILIKKIIIKTIKNAFKPKDTTNDDATYIKDAETNVIRKNDNKPISDEEIPDLIKSGYQQALEKEKLSKNPKFHLTEKEIKLSRLFARNNRYQINKHISSFRKCHELAHNVNDLNKKIELLQKTIKLYDDAKKWFYKCKGGIIYFRTFYENLHNSQNDCFSYVDIVKDELEDCINNRDYIIPGIFKAINSVPNGILQKDIYKHLPDASRGEVQRVIKKLENEGQITRVKSGNSYLLTTKETL